MMTSFDRVARLVQSPLVLTTMAWISRALAEPRAARVDGDDVSRRVRCAALRAGAAAAMLLALAACIARGNDAAKDAQESRPFVLLGNVEGRATSSGLFSSDGKKFVTMTGQFHEYAVRVWDAESLKPLTEPLPHDGVRVSKFTPDGKSLITADSKSILRWNIATSKLESAIKVTETEILRVVMSDDCTRFTVMGKDEPTSLWDAAGARRICTFTPYLFATAFDGSSRLLATVNQNDEGHGSQVRVWDTASGKELTHPVSSDMALAMISDNPIAFSPDGKRLALLKERGYAVFDIQTGKSLVEARLPKVKTTMTVHERDRVTTTRFLEESYRNPTEIRWNQSGATLCTVTQLWPYSGDGHDDPVQIWDAATAKLIKTIKCDSLSAEMSRDGKWLFGRASEHGPPVLWDAATAQTVQTFDAADGWITAISPDGRTIAFSHAFNGKDTLSIWRLRPSRPKR